MFYNHSVSLCNHCQSEDLDVPSASGGRVQAKHRQNCSWRLCARMLTGLCCMLRYVQRPDVGT